MKFKKNDVIIATSPIKPDTTICKRILNVENEKKDNIFIPPNHVWIEGDNKS